MQNRIDRLEGLVLSLMTNGAQAPGLAAASRALERNGTRSTEADEEDVDQMIKEENEDGDEIQDEVQEVESFSKMFGAMKVHKNDEDKSMFVGDNHWHMVLADVSCRSSLIQPFGHVAKMDSRSQKCATTSTRITKTYTISTTKSQKQSQMPTGKPLSSFPSIHQQRRQSCAAHYLLGHSLSR